MFKTIGSTLLRGELLRKKVKSPILSVSWPHPWCQPKKVTQQKKDVVSQDVDVSENSGTPKWMVNIMENPIKMDDLGVP